MPVTVPQSPARRLVMQTIRNAGPAGLTRLQVVQLTRLPSNSVAMFMRNLTSAGDTFAGMRTADTGRYHPYIAAEHYGAYCKAHGLPDPCIAPRAEPAADAITGRARPAGTPKVGTPLPPMGSPHRAAVVKALDAATAPLSTGELSLAAAVSINTTRRVLDALLREGRVANTGTPQARRWQKATPAARPASRASAQHYADRVCNSNRPTMRAADMPCMGSPRPGANDHLAAPSLSLDGRRPYTPPLIIGSGISGGMR